MFTQRKVGVLIACLSPLIWSVEARRGGGGGGPDISINLDLDSADTATFSFFLVFAIFSAIQLLGSFALFKKRAPQEDFPRRKAFATLLLFATASLTTQYALGAAIWANDRKESGFNSSLAPAVYAFLDFTWRLDDILLLGAILLLLRTRRNIFLQENQYAMTPSAEASYKLLPVVQFGMMFILAIIRLGIGIAEPSSNAAFEAYNAMSHIYLAFYILLIANITFSAVALWGQAKRVPSQTYPYFDQYVLKRVVQLICPALVLRALYELATHILVNLPAQTTFGVNWDAYEIVNIIFEGCIYVWVVYVALGLGKPTKKEGEEVTEKAPKA